MGREIRKVPSNWDHPITEDSYGRKRLQPMFDDTYATASANWLNDFDRIRSGGAKGYEIECYPLGVTEWASENTAPDPQYYRPWADEDATWFQVWETVSEGTPVSPPFATEDELVNYLAENGDFWDQDRCTKPDWDTLWGGKPGVSAWGKDRAEKFVKGVGWAPSFMVLDGVAKDGVAAVTDT